MGLDVMWPELELWFGNGDVILNLNEAIIGLFIRWSDISGKPKMVPMDGIWEFIMIRVHDTGRLKYTWYRGFPFFKQKIILFVKK